MDQSSKEITERNEKITDTDLRHFIASLPTPYINDDIGVGIF
jgi:hypothetical protein